MIDFGKNGYSIYRLNGISLVYIVRDGVVAFACVPNETEDLLLEEKLLKLSKGSKYPEIDPMVQIALRGDEPRRDFSAGSTTFNSSASYLLKAYDWKIFETAGEVKAVTYFKTEDGLLARHIVKQVKGYKAIEIYVEVENQTDKLITFDRVSSFTLNAITPFCEKNDMQNIVLHRLRSNWSAEGRKESLPLSNFDFEDSWSCLGIRVERFGALGSMPARGFIPFAAIEDKNVGVTWAVQQDAVSSWQIELLHRYGSVNLSGGLADRLFGHWRKNLPSGEMFTTPSAYISCVSGNLDAACAVLTKYHDTLYKFPESEQSLPVVYNEYLSSWGQPSMQNICPQLKKARELGAKYFVIDAGWFCTVNDDLLGDWEVAENKFPNGLSEFSNEALNEGFEKGGIWYEFESVTENSKVYKEHPDWLVYEDGLIVKRKSRAFLDFRKPEVVDYLTQRVISRLNTDNLTYIKIDYNENIGLGADGAESPAEGLRLHMQNVAFFMKKLRDEVPGLVMETCSSGGMRHSVFFDTVGSMVSFSDAHENADGAVVAMNLQRIVQPRTMQIWASILPSHDLDEVYFTMVKAMLGRICISGKITELSKETEEVVKRGVVFYEQIKDVIKDGDTTLIDTDEITSLEKPRGVITLQRYSRSGDKMLCYAMCFGKDERVATFDTYGYKLQSYYGNATVHDGNVVFGGKKLSAAVCVYSKNK